MNRPGRPLKPTKIALRLLRRAVKAQRAAREALDDLQTELSINQFSEQMEEALQDEIINFDLYDTKVDIEALEDLLRRLDQEAP